MILALDVRFSAATRPYWRQRPPWNLAERVRNCAKFGLTWLRYGPLRYVAGPWSFVGVTALQ